jgi:hypothetical protein
MSPERRARRDRRARGRRRKNGWRKGVKPPFVLSACPEGCGLPRVRTQRGFPCTTCGSAACVLARKRRLRRERVAEQRAFYAARGLCRCGRTARAGFRSCWRCAALELARWNRRVAQARAEAEALAAAARSVSCALGEALAAAEVAVRRRPLRPARSAAEARPVVL